MDLPSGSLTAEIARDSSRLPGTFHGDPSDRMIVATARRLGAKVATRDETMLDYAKHGHMAVL